MLFLNRMASAINWAILTRSNTKYTPVPPISCISTPKIENMARARIARIFSISRIVEKYRRPVVNLDFNCFVTFKVKVN